MSAGDIRPGEWVDAAIRAVRSVPYGPEIIVGLAIVVGLRLILVPIVQAVYGGQRKS